MKFKLQIWTDQIRGLYNLVFNLLPNIFALFSPLKDFKLFE
jgi:hypothetical protein